ncbi:amidohydrolase family protein [Haliea sp. E17]|uniref:amidohydrolase family protein n=1 Tax=Haliea sp. E17 TaxID=3401576 RepID=UPI003AABD08C
MQMEDMIIISVDDHVSEPADMFDQHLPAELKDRAPKLKSVDGADYWVYEGIVLPNTGLNAVVGRPKEEYGMEPQGYAEMRPGNYDIKARIDDMSVNGILASICFPTVCTMDGSIFSRSPDRTLNLRIIQAYNDWQIDEWAGAFPGRIIPLAILPLWDAELAAEEVKRVAKKGCHAITFPDNPANKGFASIHDKFWEPLWKACNDNKVVINCHIGTGSEPRHPSDLSPMNAWITAMPISIANAAADWLHLEPLLRYPDMKVALSEGSIGWIPYLLERAEFTNEQHIWTNVDWKGKSPTEVFREHFLCCFIEDNFGLKNYQDVGEDIIMYECDYPHSDCLWPEAPERLWQGLKDLPENVINKITHENVMREYSFDPISILGRENCTVGALRAQAAHVDTSVKSTSGLKPGEGKGVVTSGHVTAMFASMMPKETP